jgi:5-methylcytosine-specific restriction endonuclease McrA
MFDGGSVTTEMVWVGTRGWQEIDHDLRMIAKQQRVLDGEEAALLCIAVKQRVWEELGKATLLEYLEDIFGYGPKVAYERVRVALALEVMPDLREALAAGDISYSALREVTRVATAETQREWLDAIRNKNLRQVEELVRTRRKGGRPTDPADPNLMPRPRAFEVTPATDALLRQARQALATERGHFIEDDEFMSAMATAVLHQSGDEHGGAKFQIRVTRCERCDQAFQEGAGRKIAISPEDAARAECDAQRIGPDQRARQDIAPKTRRFVLHRDGGKCCVPSCRASRFNEVHHIRGRAEGGNHEAENLTLLCDGHHRALHAGTLVITGIAPNLTVRFPHVETPSSFALSAMTAEAKQALRTMGFRAPDVSQFIEAALASEPKPTTLEALIVAALKHSRPPVAVHEPES